MEDMYRNLSTVDYWEQGYGADSFFQVTELWHNQTSGKVSTLTKKIDHISMQGWVAQETSEYDDETQTLMARMVWIDVSVTDKAIKQSERTVKFLVDAFGLKLAYDYGRSCVSGAVRLPVQEQGENAQLQPFCFCYPPKIAAAWAHRQPKNGKQGHTLTQAIFFVQEEEKKALQMTLLGQWSVNVYRNPIFPSLLVALVMGVQIDATTRAIKAEIRGVETRTGYHNFASRGGDKGSKADLQDLLAKTSGSASKLASTSRKSMVVEKLLSFMQNVQGSCITASKEELRRDAAPDGNTTEDVRQSLLGYSLFKNHISVLQDRLEMQNTDIEYTLKRVHVQSDALFNIIQQMHANFNLELAQSTAQIAFFSYRDAASMKTLAVVTMFFLPGSFISALFSTNCFEWNSVDLRSSTIGVKTTPQMSLYWAITIPLTVVTFVLYFLWLALQKRERDNMVKDQMQQRDFGDLRLERTMTPASLEEAEARKLSRRAMTMLEKRGSAPGGLTW